MDSCSVNGRDPAQDVIPHTHLGLVQVPLPKKALGKTTLLNLLIAPVLPLTLVPQRAEGTPAGRPLTELTLQAGIPPDLVDSDHGGVPDFPQNIWQDFWQFRPKTERNPQLLRKQILEQIKKH